MLFVTVSETVYRPLSVYVWAVVGTVVVAVDPSPKSQQYCTMVPTDDVETEPSR